MTSSNKTEYRQEIDIYRPYTMSCSCLCPSNIQLLSFEQGITMKWKIKFKVVQHSLINILYFRPETQEEPQHHLCSTTPANPSLFSIFPNHSQCSHTEQMCNINIWNCLTIYISVFSEIQQCCLLVDFTVLD